MPTAELVGVQLDMQLLLKLGASVAAVLLVTLAYRFYGSRSERKVNLRANSEEQRRTCRKCRTNRTDGVRDGDERPDVLDSTEEAADADQLKVEQSERAQTSCSNRETVVKEETLPRQDQLCMQTCSNRETTIKEETLPRQDQLLTQTSCSNRETIVKEETLPRQDQPHRLSLGSTLKPAGPTESGPAGATGRRSPCFLQKLEGGVGVGRELRQDLGRPGGYSSFLSKAEIKVEDASVVLEGTGDQIARGKIYDYYVESSSQSVTESGAEPGPYARSPESQPAEFGSRGSSLAESPSSLSPIIMRDLVFPESGALEEASPRRSLNLRPPARPALLRQESYLSAAEDSELAAPSPTSRASSEAARSAIGPPTSGRDSAEDPAGVSGPGSVPRSKVDLGNCVETLLLAKKLEDAALRHAALSVMSDNYLQVLREPGLYGRLMAGEREQIRKQRTRGRGFVAVADMDPQDWASGAAGQPGRRTSSALYYYDDCRDAWRPLGRIPPEVVSRACAMCTMDNYLFVAVGCQGADGDAAPSKRVFCYDPLTSIWKEIRPMNEARPRCKLAALDGFVYAIGGECLSSVERYDPRADRWSFVAPLPNDTFAVAHHVTACHGELFVSGGTLRHLLLRYSPGTDAWRSSLLPSCGKDRTADMAAVGRFLYRFDVNPLLGVSVHRYHAAARLWYECGSRRLPRCPAFRCVAANGNIYCVSRQFTMRFEADDVSPAFAEGELSVLAAAKGVLFPFVLWLPDKMLRQTSV